MASRWRIRHKLLLGLGLVVCVMALLLGGTLRGLYAYWVTINTIKAKWEESSTARIVETAINKLISEDNTVQLIRDPHLVGGAIQTVDKAVDEFECSLNKTINSGVDPINVDHEQACVEDLRKYLRAFKNKVDELAGVPRAAGMAGEDAEKKKDLDAIKAHRETLKRSVNDLLDRINTSLNTQLGKKTNYQVPLWIILPSSILGFLFVIWLMRSFYSWLLNPIRALEEGVVRASKGNFRHRIELHSGDEMEDLANAFNDMQGRLQALYDDLAHQVNERSRQLVRSERLASVGFLAAGVAHEINNPLASIAFCSEALDARLGELTRHSRTAGKAAEEQEIFSKYLKMIQEEAFRCKTITERLLEFSRTGERKRESTDLRGLVQSVLNVTQHLPNHRGKHISFEVPPERFGGRNSAWVNSEEIKSVILNLVVNALESMDEGGRLTIRLGNRDGMAELRFIDNGCGMNQDVLENIFEPFFTRSRSGKGTGLGLTISHLIISQHGGDIEATSQGPGQGSTFIVRLPTQPIEPVTELTIGEDRPTLLPAMAGKAA